MLFEEPQKILIVKYEKCENGTLVHIDFLKYLLQILKYSKEDLNKYFRVMKRSLSSLDYLEYLKEE